ncbi:MAG: AAA family ATPase [Dehalococcoidia bacterium]|nr:MAG: AAA family ATPase [Dehalococcoidia bacterium]
MSFSIAIAGKGGSGKTSTASLIIRYLKRKGLVPILAVDADGNANLGESLGLNTEKTIGSIIAAFNDDKMSIPSGLTKGAYLELKLNEAIVESNNVDLISMGRGEGTGCYCYPNTVLKKFIDELKNNYAYMVMDNEAGMEHLSRRTTENIDELFVVSDHTVKGVRTAVRIIQLIGELKLIVGRLSVIINRVPQTMDNHLAKELDQFGIKPTATIPLDEEILKYDLEKRSLLNLPDTSKAVQSVRGLMEMILSKK